MTPIDISLHTCSHVVWTAFPSLLGVRLVFGTSRIAHVICPSRPAGIPTRCDMDVTRARCTRHSFRRYHHEVCFLVTHGRKNLRATFVAEGSR